MFSNENFYLILVILTEKFSLPHLDTPPPARKLLLVDDDSDIRSSITELLKDRFEVHPASDGAEAWGIISGSSERFLIVTDHRMPKMTGSTLLRQACASPVRTAGAILMSGDADISNEVRALDAEFQKSAVPFLFLRKPFTSDRLKACLSDLLSKSVFLSTAEKRLRAGNPGGIIRLALNTLEIEPALFLRQASTFCDPRLALNQSVETWDATTIGIQDWKRICDLLCLSTDTLTLGYSHKEHRARIDHALKDGVFPWSMPQGD